MNSALRLRSSASLTTLSAARLALDQCNRLAVSGKRPIGGEQGQFFAARLGNEHAVEWVRVVARKRGYCERVRSQEAIIERSAAPATCRFSDRP